MGTDWKILVVSFLGIFSVLALPVGCVMRENELVAASKDPIVTKCAITQDRGSFNTCAGFLRGK